MKFGFTGEMSAATTIDVHGVGLRGCVSGHQLARRSGFAQSRRAHRSEHTSASRAHQYVTDQSVTLRVMTRSIRDEAVMKSFPHSRCCHLALRPMHDFTGDPHPRHRPLPARQSSARTPTSRRWSTRRDAWITERTGIRERRIAPDGVVTSDMAHRRGEAARSRPPSSTRPTST